MNAHARVSQKAGWLVVAALCALALFGLGAHGLMAQNAEAPAGAAGGAPPAAEKPPADAKLTPPGNADELNARLDDKRVKVDFKNVPIEDVMEYFCDAANINIFIDWNALGEVGIGKDATISLTLHNPVALRQALRLALRSLSPRLIFNVDDEVVILENSGKPEERPNQERITRVLAVKDLAPTPESVAQLCQLIVSAVASPAWKEDGPARVHELNGQLVVIAPEPLLDQVAGFLDRLREAVKESKEKPE